VREPVLLAGLPEDIAALEQTFTPEQRLLMDVVGRIDIEKQPISDLVEAGIAIPWRALFSPPAIAS
jgi:hypothetical protein